MPRSRAEPIDIEPALAALGFKHQNQLTKALGISDARLKRMIDGKVPMPRSISLAIAALVAGLPPWSAPAEAPSAGPQPHQVTEGALP